MLRGGGVERRERAQFERLPGEVMFFHSGEPHQCINKLSPARNLNLEIGSAFLQDGLVSEAAIGVAVTQNPDVKFVRMLLLGALGSDPADTPRRPPWII